jgi:hypothetical protein
MHFSPQSLDGKGMAEFVKGLQERKSHPEENNVGRSQNPICDILGELGPVKACEKNSSAHDDEPENGSQPAEKGANEGQESDQESFRVEDGKTHEERVSNILLPFNGPPLFKALQEFLRVRRDVALKNVHGMELAEKANHLLLSRSFFSKAGSRLFPDLLNGPFPIHQSDEEIGGCVETLKSTCGMVLENVPDLSAIVVAMNLPMAPKSWLQPRHPIPRRTVERSSHIPRKVWNRYALRVTCFEL